MEARGCWMVEMRQGEGQNQSSLSHGPRRTGQDPLRGTPLPHPLSPDWVVEIDPTYKLAFWVGGCPGDRGGTNNKSRHGPGMLRAGTKPAPGEEYLP